MVHPRSVAVAVALALLSAAPVAARAVDHACTFADGAGRGCIGPEVLIAHRPGARRAGV